MTTTDGNKGFLISAGIRALSGVRTNGAPWCPSATRETCKKLWDGGRCRLKCLAARNEWWGYALWKAAYLLALGSLDPDVRLLRNLFRACFQHLIDRSDTCTLTTDEQSDVHLFEPYGLAARFFLNLLNQLTTSVKCAPPPIVGGRAKRRAHQHAGRLLIDSQFGVLRQRPQ